MFSRTTIYILPFSENGQFGFVGEENVGALGTNVLFTDEAKLLDFFLWGYMKLVIPETPVESELDPLARIVVAAGMIQKIYEFLNVSRNPF